MPTLSTFYGIIIKMLYDDHNPPHIHAEYSGSKALFDFEENTIKGSLPVNKIKLVSAWIELHKEELGAYWHLASRSENIPSFSIEPLK
ncbi:MAG: DUF4160 domain-containing protein [Treponematales bacterium]